MAEEIPQSESFLNPSRRSYVYESSRGGGNKKRVILILLGVIILIALVAYAVIATGGKGEIDESLTPTQAVETPTPTLPAETPTPEVSPTATPKVSPTPAKGSPTPTTSASSDLERSNLKIEVLNGSGVAGAATKMSDALKKLGYEVVSSGNADNFEYEETEIQVKSTKKAYIEMLKEDLGDDYTIGSATSDYTGSDADAVIIVGKE